MTNDSIQKIVNDALERMTLDEKIGQCLTQSWRGSLITPSVLDNIDKLHCGGLRIEPYTTESAQRLSYGRKIDTRNWTEPEGYFKPAETYFPLKYPGMNISAAEYTQRLNRLKDVAMNRPSGVPLHICTDFEGDFSHDFPFAGIRLFPGNMGLRAAGEPDLARDVALAIGRQLAAIGIDMLHSPVCDVNVNPANPEINIRAFSDDADVFRRYVVPFMQGLEQGGVIATAKHFAGRGDSSLDAHHDLPVLHADRARMNQVELAPYRALIASGLRAVMMAHNAYPALDPSALPASLSPAIIRDVLRKELGFQGVVTTDAMGMGAIVARWGVPMASAMAIKAGCNLVLLKFDDELRSQTFFEIKRWIDDGRLTREELDESLRYLLRMKAEQGLFDTGGKKDPDQAQAVLREPGIAELSRDVAARATMVLRDREHVLPLSPDKKVLVIEQMIIPEFVPNNAHHHPFQFNEAMLRHSRNIVNATTSFRATEEEQALIVSLLAQVDAVAMTNYYWRVIKENNTPLVETLVKSGIPLAVVTNNPYPMGAVPSAGAVVCTFGVGPESLKAAAAVLYGKQTAPGRWPLEHTAKTE